MEADVSEQMRAAPVGDLEALQRHVSDLKREADAATRVQDRMAWILYAAIFVLIPFVVVLFRRHLQAWHYYVAGATFLALALVACVMDLVGAARRDKATQAIQRAQEEYEVARLSRRDDETGREPGTSGETEA